MANGQCLTQPAKDHFLMSNQSRQTYTVRGDLLGPLAGSLPDITNQVRRAASRTGGRIQLGGVMQLYDLAITVVPSRLAGKFHHQYGTKRKVRSNQYGDSLLLGPPAYFFQSLGGQTSGPHDCWHPVSDAGEHVLQH